MKTDEKKKGQAAAAEIEALLHICKCKALPACKRAGMATSTLFRWKQGQEPAAGSIDRLKLAILSIAEEKGTLQTSFEADLAMLRRYVRTPVVPSQKRDLAARVDRLERVVEEQLGGVL